MSTIVERLWAPSQARWIADDSQDNTVFARTPLASPRPAGEGGMIRCGTPEMEDADAKEREDAARHFGEVMDDVIGLAALRAENARLREEMKRANESTYENASAAHDEIKRLREELMRRIQASGETHPWGRACVVTGVQCDEICRCRTQMERTLEYRSPDSVRAALRGDDASEGT